MCSLRPVATAKTLGSKIISSGGYLTSLVKISYDLLQISFLLSKESACPFSSKAMTIIAAPYLRHAFATLMKSSSPSLRLIELTIALPCITFKPLSITSHLEESMTIGTFDISGSVATSFKK